MFRGITGAIAPACLLVALYAPAGQANPITFSFTGSSGNVSSINQTAGATSLLVTPFTSPNRVNDFLSQSPTSGLGVGFPGIFTLSPFFLQIGDTNSGQVDNFGTGEAIDFSFSGPYPGWRIDSITFVTNTGQGIPPAQERFALSVDGVSVALGALANGNLINPGGASGTFQIDLSNLPESVRTGADFRISPSGGGSDFRIAAIEVTPIPEPTTLAVFGLCAAGAGVYGWRRRKAQPAA